MEKAPSGKMVNKHHEYILRAFLEVKLPYEVRKTHPSLLVTDSGLEECCMQLMRNERRFKSPDPMLIVGDDADTLLRLVGSLPDDERDELLDYYRLMMLTVSVLRQYIME